MGNPVGVQSTVIVEQERTLSDRKHNVGFMAYKMDQRPFRVMPVVSDYMAAFDRYDRFDGFETRHVWANSGDRPGIISNQNPIQTNPGTIGLICPRCQKIKMQFLKE